MRTPIKHETGREDLVSKPVCVTWVLHDLKHIICPLHVFKTWPIILYQRPVLRTEYCLILIQQIFFRILQNRLSIGHKQTVLSSWLIHSLSSCSLGGMQSRGELPDHTVKDNTPRKPEEQAKCTKGALYLVCTLETALWKPSLKKVNPISPPPPCNVRGGLSSFIIKLLFRFKFQRDHTWSRCHLHMCALGRTSYIPCGSTSSFVKWDKYSIFLLRRNKWVKMCRVLRKVPGT